jgi:hypothetical protein
MRVEARHDKEITVGVLLAGGCGSVQTIGDDAQEASRQNKLE